MFLHWATQIHQIPYLYYYYYHYFMYPSILLLQAFILTYWPTPHPVAATITSVRCFPATSSPHLAALRESESPVLSYFLLLSMYYTGRALLLFVNLCHTSLAGQIPARSAYNLARKTILFVAPILLPSSLQLVKLLQRLQSNTNSRLGSEYYILSP